MKKLLLALALCLIPAAAHAQLLGRTMYWTATGDDSLTGTATKYDMRWSYGKPDTSSAASKQFWWETASLSVPPIPFIVKNLPAPKIAGSLESFTIVPQFGFVADSTVYVVIQVKDEQYWSDWSNVAWFKVPKAPDLIRPRRITNFRPNP